ncbi:MAG: histidine phosphatase family protein, partial [Bacteroidetes bacterium]
EKYAGEGFEVVLTSTLQRTRQTVRSFIESGIPWEQFPEIDEMSWGVHEGQKPDATMIAEYKTLMEHWKNEQYDAKLDGGESARQLGQRIDRFIEILKKRPERKILVCTHGRAMRALICRMKNQPLKNMEHVGHKNTGLYIARFDGNEFHFLTENERSHWTRPAT